MTFAEQQREMAERVIREALDIVRIEARLRELSDDAIERAPACAAWCAGRLAGLAPDHIAVALGPGQFDLADGPEMTTWDRRGR